jgi:hypothetical protein
MTKGKNNRMPKAQPRQEISIDPGNIDVLSVKLLNDINNNLVQILKELKK